MYQITKDEDIEKCEECEETKENCKCKTIKASQLCKSMGISFIKIKSQKYIGLVSMIIQMNLYFGKKLKNFITAMSMNMNPMGLKKKSNCLLQL